ncbi:MAG: S8 family serine peptidase, partial [Bryobacteraceae bacterium]|nr:S8 family serine peptidase [Bryobacteraceae bacterium]
MKLAGLFVLAACALFAAETSAAVPRERFVLLLHDQPLGADPETPVNGKAMTKSARAGMLAAKQQTLRAALAERKISITASDQILVNAVFVEAPAGSRALLQALPGVDRVERLRPLKRHLDTAASLLNVSAAWSAVNGEQNAGAGVKIAILDTGIDISHPAMQDASLQYPEGFPKCRQEAGECAFVNTKVVAARSYVSMLVGTNPATSRPDDLSPRDRVGHGTAVAGIAAGVRSTGPAATITGVAPKAWLGNYKIFGSPGVNGTFTFEDVLVTALREAIADGMNIAVVTIGVPAEWGPGDTGGTCQRAGSQPCDWRAAAVENAVRQGITVVVSAGNDGDNATIYPAFNSINSPGTAPSAITVGASTNSHIYYQSIRINGPGVPADIARINTYFTDGPRPATGFQASLRDINDSACNALSPGSLTGVIAVIPRGDCEFPVKIANAQRAGAVGVIFYQSNQNATGTFRIRGAEETGIPAALIGSRVGSSLRNYIGQQPSATATFDPVYVSIATTEFDTMASFSSRGPSIREGALKPELVAVGTDLYTATQRFDPNGNLYDPSGYTAAQGTSFAAPFVAGAVALVKQRYPSMTPLQLKSAVVNTADNRIQDIDGTRVIVAGGLDQGAGKLNAGAAVQTNVTVEPSTLSWGVLGNTLPSTATSLRFCNFGTSGVNLRVSVAPLPGQNSSASVNLSGGNSVSVQPGACNSNLSVRLTGSRPRAGVYEGDVLITGGTVPLHIPYLYVVGDNIPFSAFPLVGDRFETTPGVARDLVFKVVDRFGAPVSNANVRFQAVTGGGSIASEGRTTDALGIGYASAVIGQTIGDQSFFSFIGNEPNFGLFFSGIVRPLPTISANGVVDAASGEAGRAFAAGSYVSIFGQGLSDSLREFNTPYLPISLAGVSVSFDVPSANASYPARLQVVSQGQINVVLPWELQGAPSAQMKVSIGDNSSELVTIPLAASAPSVFEYTEASGQRLAAAVSDGRVVGTAAPARRGAIVSIYANGLGPVDNQPA